MTKKPRPTTKQLFEIGYMAGYMGHYYRPAGNALERVVFGAGRSAGFKDQARGVDNVVGAYAEYLAKMAIAS